MILWELFSTFFKIGLFTIGGGYAMIPMIKEEVAQRAWMTQTQLVDFIAVAESTPGPFAINTATYIGITQGGLLGAAAATLGVVLPSFLIILLIARFFKSFQNHFLVRGALHGMRPAVVGLIAAAVLSLASGNLVSAFVFTSFPAFFATINWLPVGIFAVILTVSLLFKKLHPVKLILLSAVLGIVGCSILDACGVVF